MNASFKNALSLENLLQFKESDLKQLTFEQAVEVVETTSQLIESAKLPLEQSFILYELGVKTTQHCEQLLENIEKKVEMLNRSKSTSSQPQFDAVNPSQQNS